MKKRTILGSLLILLTATAWGQSPGNVSGSFWLKADAGVEESASNPAENGDRVSGWLDQINSNSCTQSTSSNRPIYRNNTSDNINYNPVLEFIDNSGTSNDSYFDLDNAEVGDFDFYMVVQTSQTTSNTAFWGQPLFYGGDENIAMDIAITLDNNGKFHVGGGRNGDFDVAATTTINDGQTHILQMSRTVNGTSNSDFNWRVDGAENGSSNRTETNNGTDMASDIKMGLHGNGEAQSYDGFIAEMGIFGSALSSTNRSRVESYLAIKYGMTLPNNYENTAGETIYNVSTYSNDIIGIGRDDNEELLQKQSHDASDTMRIYASSLATSNASNTATTGNFGADRAYVIMGHNNGFMCAQPSTISEIPAGVNSRLNREWKVTNSRFTGTFGVDFKIAGCGNGSVTASHLRLLVDSDGDFSNATIIDAGDGVSISYAGGVVSVTGISTTHIPSNTTRFITIASTNTATPLPVELGEFQIQNREDQVDLYWNTWSEINSDYFSVERSADKDQWKEIGQVGAAGFSSDFKEYEFSDYDPLTGHSYYRLKQIDFDGQYEYSSIRLNYRNNLESASKPKVFYLTNQSLIQVTGMNSTTGVPKLTNLFGQLLNGEGVLEKGESGEWYIHSETLAAGTYVLYSEEDDLRVLITLP
ncbi:hypothetical protein KFE98_18065 [bacterium SCSIO 12741]|nr:hypothetical protein KFE98_18065 [bacterium SCSIO 12741]